MELHLGAAVEGFLAGYFFTCRRSAKTFSGYGCDLRQFQRFLGCSTLLRSVETEQIENWAKDLRDRGFRPSSIRRKYAAVRVFFAYWVRRGSITQSPLSRVRLDLGRERRLPRNISESEAKRLIEKIWWESTPSGDNLKLKKRRFLHLRNVAIIEVLFATGMRVGELVNLRVGDWRSDEASLLVNGKGSLQRLAFLPDIRSVTAILGYLAVREELQCETDHIFVATNGKRLLTQGVAGVIACSARNAALSTRLTPHMIRHTVATLLLRRGADIRIVQEVLGHASISTTQRYVHVSKDLLRETLRQKHPSLHMELALPRALS